MEQFTNGFVWGTATSAYQIEGAASLDGRGPSVWDTFARTAGNTFDGHTGDVACDHYHRFREDVAIMKAMGLQAYRFSISWSRIMPDGTGAVNEKGLAFYEALVDELLRAGIAPWVTLFHWDYPQALYDRGGWLNPESPEWFGQYTAAVVDRLSDRVTNWITLNEPQCFIAGGPESAPIAPAGRIPLAQQLQATHHAMIAHGVGVDAIRGHARKQPHVGWAPVGVVCMPASDRPEDVDAARRATLGIWRKDLWNNSWYADAVLKGCYPEDGLKLYHGMLPAMRAADFERMRRPIDFYGLNIYSGTPVRAGANGAIEVAPRPAGYARTAFNWPLDPHSLYWGPRFIHERYGLPIYITENGLSGHDWVHDDGAVHDAFRIDFLRSYLRELRRACSSGVDIRGYFQWSLMDNFEWAEGYRQRFGLVHVDFQTLKRTPKDSAAWYRTVIEANGANL